LHSAPVLHKTITEKAKEIADTVFFFRIIVESIGIDVAVHIQVNKKVGQGLASVLDKGENVTQSAKETVRSAARATEEKSKESSGLAKQKGNQASHNPFPSLTGSLPRTNGILRLQCLPERPKKISRR
jgi:hypothetical protein